MLVNVFNDQFADDDEGNRQEHARGSEQFSTQDDAERGMTVFLTTHYMEEAAEADYVVILDSGKIAAEGTPLQLKNAYTGDFITVYGADEKEIASFGKPYEIIRDAVRISVRNTEEARDLILSHPKIFRDFEITKGKMDDVFLAVTGKKLTGGNPS